MSLSDDLLRAADWIDPPDAVIKCPLHMRELAARLRAAALPATAGVEDDRLHYLLNLCRARGSTMTNREILAEMNEVYTAPPRPQMTEAEVRERFVANFKPQLTGAGIIWEGYIAALRDAGLVKP